MHFDFTFSCNELWAKKQTLPDTVRFAWMHNLPGDEPAQPQEFQGHGFWLRRLPRGSSTSLPDCVFRWGLQPRLGSRSLARTARLQRHPGRTWRPCLFLQLGACLMWV